MKYIAILLCSLYFTNLTFAQVNILQEGNICFAKGDYDCAITKYKSVINLPDSRQKKIAGDNLKQAEKCLELLKMADNAFNSKNYIKAKEYYQNLLTENASDTYAKSKLIDIKVASITLSISKNTILFSNFGGKEQVNVFTNADSYTLELLPSWCSVEKFDKHFFVYCTENISGTERAGSLTVKAGSKSETITIRQTKEQVIRLSVSNENISFNSTGGNSDHVFVYTNATKYLFSNMPSWCSIKTYNDYFIISADENEKTQNRSDWFKIIAENKEVKIYVTQSGRTPTVQINSFKSPRVKKISNKYFFMNLGSVINDLDNIETMMFTMGVKKFYVRVKFNPKVLEDANYFSTLLLSNELEIANTGRIQNFPTSSNYYYVVNDQIANSRQAITIGTSFGGQKLRFYLAAGYGQRFNFWGLNLNSYTNNQYVGNIWAKNINQSWKGIELEYGLFLKLGQFNIMAGASTILDSNQRPPFFDFHVGIGFTTR